jgi:hypothetical protein
MIMTAITAMTAMMPKNYLWFCRRNDCKVNCKVNDDKATARAIAIRWHGLPKKISTLGRNRKKYATMEDAVFFG